VGGTVLDAVLDRLEWSQRAHLASLMNLPENFLDQLRSTAVADGGDGSRAPVTQADAERMTRSYRWLLGRVGPDGFKLTQAG
jgi:hypothetical protein